LLSVFDPDARAAPEPHAAPGGRPLDPQGASAEIGAVQRLVYTESTA
jgi:hypothetical protein